MDLFEVHQTNLDVLLSVGRNYVHTGRIHCHKGNALMGLAFVLIWMIN